MLGFSKLGRLTSKSRVPGLGTVTAAGCIGTGSMLELDEEELWRLQVNATKSHIRELR